MNGSEHTPVVRRRGSDSATHEQQNAPPRFPSRLCSITSSSLSAVSTHPLSITRGTFSSLSTCVSPVALWRSNRRGERVPRSLRLEGRRLPNTMNYIFPCASHTAFQYFCPIRCGTINIKHRPGPLDSICRSRAGKKKMIKDDQKWIRKMSVFHLHETELRFDPISLLL